MSLEHFEGDSFRDPAIRALLPRIHAAPHPDMSMASTEHFGAEVRATLTDGRVLSAKVARPLGRGPENPLPTELLEAKFLNCATRALTDGRGGAAAGDVARRRRGGGYAPCDRCDGAATALAAD